MEVELKLWNGEEMDLVSVIYFKLASIVMVEGKFECRDKIRERKLERDFELWMRFEKVKECVCVYIAGNEKLAKTLEERSECFRKRLHSRVFFIPFYLFEFGMVPLNFHDSPWRIHVYTQGAKWATASTGEKIIYLSNNFVIVAIKNLLLISIHITSWLKFSDSTHFLHYNNNAVRFD